MGVRVRVNRVVSTEVGNLTPGFEYTVPPWEARRLREIGAIEETEIEAAARTAQLIPEEAIEEVARVGARVHRQAKGATATR